MRAPRTIAALVAVAAAAVAMAGCGSSNDLPSDIPPASAQKLEAYLTQIAARCDVGDLANAQRSAAAYMIAVNRLEGVDSDVRQLLLDTGQHLTSLTQDGTGCDTGASGASGLSGFVPSKSKSTASTETSASTTTAPTTTETTTTTTTPEQPTPQNGGDENQGNPGGAQGEGGGGEPAGGGSGGSSGSGGIGAG